MTMTFGPGITIGAGIAVDLSGNSFTLSSTDFTNFGYGGGVTPNGTNGFTTSNPSRGPGNECYSPNLSLNNGGNPSALAAIRAYFAANSLNTGGSNAYMFNVTWGAGSTVGSGVAIVEFFDYGDNNSSLSMGAVNTSIPGWDTPGSDYFSGPPYSLVGTFNFPATFTVITPLIVNNNNWC